VRVQKPITLSSLDITIIDNPKRKSVVVRIHPVPRQLVLWSGDDYTVAGDYTQQMVESRVTELLGNDPKSILEGLFVTPSRN
jgi:hypothetical protein